MEVLSDKTRFEWVKRQLLAIPKGQSLLDAGAGELKYKPFCSHLKYVSQDFNGYVAGKEKTGLHPKNWDTSGIDIVSDIIKIPVKSKSFDNILCSEVFEHIPDPELAIEEFSRILKNNGKLILTAPFCAQTHFAPYFFHTGFSIYWYKYVFKKNGFKIVRFSQNGNYFDYLVQELLRTPLMAKRYTFLNWVALLLYIVILPLVIIFLILSSISRNSETQLYFGSHIVARKVTTQESKSK